MNVIAAFMVLQAVLFFFMTFHDWVHLPPLTNIRELEKHSTPMGRLVNSAIFAIFIAVPLSLTYLYNPMYPLWVMLVLVSVYALLTFGTIASWWIPYIFGSSEQHKKDFAEYGTTHHFLPPRGDNVVPNTLHVLLHLQIWACLAISVWLLIKVL